MKYRHEFKDLDEDGNLQYCHKCMGMEGSLPSMCPEEPMSNEVSDRVYAGNYDFRGDEGWVESLSPMGESILYSRLCALYGGLARRLPSEEAIRETFKCSDEDYNKIKKKVIKHYYGTPKDREGDVVRKGEVKRRSHLSLVK